MIHVSKIMYNEEPRILLTFAYDIAIHAEIKKVKEITYSSTNKGWHMPYHKSNWASFQSLNLPYHIENSGTTDVAKSISDNTGEKIAAPPPDCNKQVADTQNISIRYMHPYFFLRGELKPTIIAEVKKIPNAYYNSRYQNWVIPACPISLDAMVQIGIITSEQSDNWKTQIESISDPQICTLYSSPEYPDKVLVQLKGRGIDIEFMKNIPQRQYSSNGKFWCIPNEREIINRIADHYIAKGTKLINRIKQNYQTKRQPTQGVYKKYQLSKTGSEIQEVCSLYLDTLTNLRYSTNTMKEYYSRFAIFAKTMLPYRCDEISVNQVNNFLAQISSRNISITLINSYINAIKFYYEKVVFLPEFKLERIKRPKEGLQLPKVLSIEQIDRILRSTQNLKHTTLLYALYGHGIRLNELLCIRLDDILWDRNQIFIKSGKGNKDRYIPMSQEFKTILQIYIHSYKTQYWLFEGQDQKNQYSSRSVQQVVQQAARKAKISIKVTPHMIRHSFATHLLDIGTQLPYIKELLGHRDIKTTMIYTHVTTASIENVVSPLDRLKRNPPKQ